MLSVIAFHGYNERFVLVPGEFVITEFDRTCIGIDMKARPYNKRKIFHHEERKLFKLILSFFNNSFIKYLWPLP